MEVKACPPVCKFDWDKFFHDIDWAMAHMIEEVDGTLPSKTSMLELAEFANKKREAQKEQK